MKGLDHVIHGRCYLLKQEDQNEEQAFGSGIDQHHPLDLPAVVEVLHVYATWGCGALEMWFL